MNKSQGGIVQTYSHLAYGVVLGAAVFPHQPMLQIVCACGSVAPDLTMVPAYALDLLSSRQPMAEQSKTTMLLKNISHSLVLWGLSASVWWFYRWPWVGAVVLGGGIHCLVDVLTHDGKRFAETEPSYLWPGKFKLGQKIGIYEYRFDYGILKPKVPETILLFLALGGIIWLYAR